MTTIEELLVDKGYWKWTKGDHRSDPYIMGTAKWNHMLKALRKAYPNKIIEEKMIKNFIINLDAD